MSGRPWLVAQLDAMHRSRGGDWYYRTFAPGRALAELPDVYVVNVDQAHRKLGAILEQADVVVANGVCSADLLGVIARRKALGRLTVFEINDDVQGIQDSNPLAGFFRQPENLRLFRRLALTADAVQYSVPELGRLYGSLNARGRVFLNQVVAPPPLRPPRDNEQVLIGWGGSAGHLEDVAEIAPTLISFVEQEPRVTLCLMCSDRIWQLFDALPDARKRRTPVGSIDDYYAFVAQLDIALAPNRDKAFNRARSDVKFLECAGWGAVAVVRRLVPYLDSVKHGENGWLFDSPADLQQLLTRLVSNPSERQTVRERAHAYVMAERLQAPHAMDRLAFYQELQPQAPSGSQPARVFAELAALEGAEVSGRYAMLAHTRYETLLHDGLVSLQSGQGRAAGENLLREAVELEPTHDLPSLFLGAQLGSVPDLLQALHKNPRSVQAALALGQAHLQRGEHQQALQRFLSAAELASGYEMPFAYAAATLRALGAVKDAAEMEQLAQHLARAVT